MSKKTTTKKKENKKIPAIATHTIDATGRVLGRLASEVSSILRGKNKPSFEYYLDNGDRVVVTNASKIKTTGQKMTQKKYHHFSGYPGGIKTKTMTQIFAKNPAEVLERAIFNMLPKNKLRAKMIKRLKITN
ncbi:50S ribosomal protein L13 [Candidatus Falkowbacteria bacterium]|nr:50S ribosomal protein L13 [Candidatus Falkowbacteria bacterium]